jgi:hypothetical protein
LQPTRNFTRSPGDEETMAELTTVSSVAELHASTTLPTDGSPVYLLGYYEPGDGGEGMFWYNSTPPPGTVENLGTILVDALGGFWYRAGTGTAATPDGNPLIGRGNPLLGQGGQNYNVKWFGAKGNNNTEPSDMIATRAAIQHAISVAGAARGTVWFPPGLYRVNGQINITPHTAGPWTTLLGGGNPDVATAIIVGVQLGTADLFNVDGTLFRFHPPSVVDVGIGFAIRGIDLISDVAQAGPGGAAIHLYACGHVDIESLTIGGDGGDTGFYNGILNDSSGDVYIRRVNLALANVPIREPDTYRYGVKCTWPSNDFGAGHAIGNGNLTVCDCVNVSGNTKFNDQMRLVPGSARVHGFVLANKYQSLTLIQCGALGCWNGRWVTKDPGVSDNGDPNYLVDNFGTSDHSATGWQFDAGPAGGVMQLSNCLCISSGDNNYYVYVTCAADVQFTGCRVSASGNPDVHTRGAGFALDGSGRYTLSGCRAAYTGGHNVEVSFGAVIAISGCVLEAPGLGTNPDRDSIHIYPNATGQLALAGIVQWGPCRHGLYDEGSQCLIYGNGIFNDPVCIKANSAFSHWGRYSSVAYPTA